MIRFQRIGRKNDPAFRISLLEKARAAKAGRVTEQLGTYNPKTKAVTIKADRVKYWLSQGAQATDSVHNLLITQGVIEGKKINALPKKTVQKKEEEKTNTTQDSASEETTKTAPVAEAPKKEESTPPVAEPTVEASPESAPATEEAVPDTSEAKEAKEVPAA